MGLARRFLVLAGLLAVAVAAPVAAPVAASAQEQSPAAPQSVWTDPSGVLSVSYGAPLRDHTTESLNEDAVFSAIAELPGGIVVCDVERVAFPIIIVAGTQAALNDQTVARYDQMRSRPDASRRSYFDPKLVDFDGVTALSYRSEKAPGGISGTRLMFAANAPQQIAVFRVSCYAYRGEDPEAQAAMAAFMSSVRINQAAGSIRPSP